jgi:hypothetical protein
MNKDMLDAKYREIRMYKTTLEGKKVELVDGYLEVKINNRLQRDAFLVFRAWCKLLIKSLPQEGTLDLLLMRGKAMALEKAFREKIIL